MMRLRWRALLLLTALLGVTGGASAAAHAGPLSGTWSGYISGGTGYGTLRQHMTITINSAETRGTWRISASCQGVLTLDSISGGYHHYRRHVARGSSCAGGDIDCLKRAGAGLYDAVTSHRGGAWDTSGTLRRARV